MKKKKEKKRKKRGKKMMDNQGHAVMLPTGEVLSWEALKMDSESKNATNSQSSHFQKVTSKEKIQ